MVRLNQIVLHNFKIGGSFIYIIMLAFGYENLDEVIENLYLGNAFQAENKAILEKFKITHILTAAKNLHLNIDKVLML
jgi:hypothetical protein